MSRKNLISASFVFLSLALNSCVLAASFDRDRRIYDDNLEKEILYENSGGLESLSKESLWLLAEKHYLGRGVEVNEVLAKKYIEKASARSSSVYPKSLLSFVNKRFYSRQRAVHSDSFYRNLDIEPRRCKQFETRPTELFFYFFDPLGPR